MKRVVYISAGSVKWGMGHLLRSSELISLLRDRGVELASFLLMPKVDYDILNTHMAAKSYDVRVASLQDIDIAACDALVVDVPEELQAQLSAFIGIQRKPLFALDWYYDEVEEGVERFNLRGGVRSLEYAIVRKEYLPFRERSSSIRAEYDAVVVMGGGDARGRMPHICEMLSARFMFNNKVACVLGPFIPKDMFRDLNSLSENMCLFREPPNLAELMAAARIGITNGGTTMLEFAFLGVPTVIVPQSVEEDAFIKPIIQEGCGVLGDLENEGLVQQVEAMLQQEDMRKQMSEKARCLIDGKGVFRIADRIVSKLQSCH